MMNATNEVVSRIARGPQVLALATVLLSIVMFAAVGVAPASATPKGEYATFADCPLTVPELQGCLVGRTESGELTVGNQSVPIKHTQTLQGGIIETGLGEYNFFGAADGNTFSKTAQTVPGGLLGTLCAKLPEFLKVLCDEDLGKGLAEVKAVTELAAPATSIKLNELNLEIESGTALTLPVKVKLENTFLGSSCYIGSNSEPITLNLTTGATSPPSPNKSIKGKLGTESSRAEGGILVIKSNTLVDNSFAAPGVNGCGGIFAFLIDPILDSQLGLPAKAGHNTAILNGTLEQASAILVKDSE